MAQVELTVNGVARHLEPDDGETLLQTLRERLGLVAAKVGCSQGYCGACTVLLEGSPALACMLQTAKLAGRRIVTLEGLPDKQRQLLARAFVQEGAVQCGYCTPGLVMRTHWLVDKGRTSDRDAVVKALGSHMCRCTGYLRVLDAISTAGEAAATGGFTTAEPRRVPRFAAPRHQGCRSSKGVGTSQPRYRGEQLALGEKPFIGDLRCEGMLHGAVVLAAHPRARVLGIDAAPALAMSGVARVLTAADVPGQRLLGTVVRDWPAFVAVGELTRCVVTCWRSWSPTPSTAPMLPPLRCRSTTRSWSPSPHPSRRSLPAHRSFMRAVTYWKHVRFNAATWTLRWPPRLTP